MGANALPTDLGTKKIGTLLSEYAWPGIIAMTASSLYNMVDSVYIGHLKDVGALAISGLGVTAPIMNLSSALGTLVGVGAATMTSVYLGQRNYHAAEKALCNEVTLNTIIGILFSVVTLLFLDPILLFFGASENTLPFARDYLKVILWGNVITHLYFGLNSMIRVSGAPKLAMNLTLFTVISNAVLDPVFIFALGMGVKGAALATVLCQLMSLTYALYYFTKGKAPIKLPKHIFGLDTRIAKNTLAIGMGPFLMNAAACIVSLFLNQQLLKYGGDLAIGAYGIANRIIFLFVMVVMGLNQGMQPIAGYNYGARKYTRVKEVFNLTIKWAIGVMTAGFLVAQLIPGAAVSLFTNDQELKVLSEKALRILCLMLPLVGYQMVSTNLFQSLAMVKKSIFLSLSRQLIFLVPAVYLLPLWLGIEGVWWSYPVSDFIAFAITLVMMISLMKRLQRMQEGEDPKDILTPKEREEAERQEADNRREESLNR